MSKRKPSSLQFLYILFNLSHCLYMADSKIARIEFGREEYYFYFKLVDDAFVLTESSEIFKQHSKDKRAEVLKSATYRIEFYGEEDLEMDYFPDYFYLMELLSKHSNILIYDYLNHDFI